MKGEWSLNLNLYSFYFLQFDSWRGMGWDEMYEMAYDRPAKPGRLNLI